MRIDKAKIRCWRYVMDSVTNTLVCIIEAEANGVLFEAERKEKGVNMWLKVDDAHEKIVNLVNANWIYTSYVHGSYNIYAEFVGGGSTLLKVCTNEKEASDFVKDLYQQLL